MVVASPLAVSSISKEISSLSLISSWSSIIPKPFNNKKLSKYKQVKLRKGFKRRAAIAPTIGHLKSDYRLNRNFYMGIVGDNINVMLAAAAFNFKRMYNKYKTTFFACFFNWFKKCIQELKALFEVKEILKISKIETFKFK